MCIRDSTGTVFGTGNPTGITVNSEAGNNLILSGSAVGVSVPDTVTVRFGDHDSDPQTVQQGTCVPTGC